MRGKFRITEDMAMGGMVCPFCHQFIKGNGTGPEGAELLNKLISALPSDDILHYGSMAHDLAYHMKEQWGSKEDADLMMYEINERKIEEKAHWYSRWYYRLMNRRNLRAVQMFGGSAWDNTECEDNKKK